ncbi:hypothetical protein KAFR_0C04260 [Kazachstania africana CBS 2517]|uniref:DNA mismatch repair protein HSM3 n=1 Tax=Kazachstania africana (strain ATCC 22294 / BCRC 22015 / CBS 2517 / CECT 1963 / NBRC 1671 / NRRL Y-8276) TaxID=1071382 RepID=H2ASR7_KAZAF|nr:hypothetical protein KAFR_0C04260 [Kazachstania africana CBS 2517]CCF57417.1 hypothetical protein KAFR_0C04260 [Kazachstania africana CBS 2517]
MSSIQLLLSDLNASLSIEPLPRDVNDQILKSALNLKTISSLDDQSIMLQVLDKIKSLLYRDNIRTLDYTLLFDLSDIILQLVDSELLNQIISLEDLHKALESSNTNIIILSCKIITKFNTFKTFQTDLLYLYFNTETEDIKLISEVENIFQYHVLTNCGDDLVQDNLSFLSMVKNSNSPVLISRLLEFLTISMENSQFNQIYIFDINYIYKFLNLDIFLFINLLRFYTNILNREAWGQLDLFMPIMEESAKIFSKQDEMFPEIKSFALSYLFKFFAKISYLSDDSYFKTLDDKYFHITSNDYIIDFLSFVNPLYLMKYYHDFIEGYVKIKPSHLSILRNLISNITTFNLIQPMLTTNNILEMPFLEQLVLTEKISQFKYSSIYLVNLLPKLMSDILDTNIIEPECLQFKENIVDNLLNVLSKEELNIWYTPLNDEYLKITHNLPPSSKRNPKTNIASEFM